MVLSELASTEALATKKNISAFIVRQDDIIVLNLTSKTWTIIYWPQPLLARNINL